MGRRYMVRRNGSWYDSQTGNKFVGIVRSNGLTYRLTRDGQKVLLTKPKPNVENFVRNIWNFENPQHRGLINGIYRPFKTANGNIDIGAGIDISRQTPAFRRKAYKGFTPEEMHKELTRRAAQKLQQALKALKPYTNFPDTVSPQIITGLADLSYQVGSLGGYPKLLRSVAKGDLNGIRRESRVMFKNKNGQMQFDKRRYDARNSSYFYYRQGGMISPLMESIMPNAYKESSSEQMKREQTRRAAQKLQQKGNALKSGTNVKNNIFASLAKQISLHC